MCNFIVFSDLISTGYFLILNAAFLFLVKKATLTETERDGGGGPRSPCCPHTRNTRAVAGAALSLPVFSQLPGLASIRWKLGRSSPLSCSPHCPSIPGGMGMWGVLREGREAKRYWLATFLPPPAAPDTQAPFSCWTETGRRQSLLQSRKSLRWRGLGYRSTRAGGSLDCRSIPLEWKTSSSSCGILPL